MLPLTIQAPAGAPEKLAGWEANLIETLGDKEGYGIGVAIIVSPELALRLETRRVEGVEVYAYALYLANEALDAFAARYAPEVLEEDEDEHAVA